MCENYPLLQIVFWNFFNTYSSYVCSLFWKFWRGWSQGSFHEKLARLGRDDVKARQPSGLTGFLERQRAPEWEGIPKLAQEDLYTAICPQQHAIHPRGVGCPTSPVAVNICSGFNIKFILWFDGRREGLWSHTVNEEPKNTISRNTSQTD